jgi:hypothetical protein
MRDPFIGFNMALREVDREALTEDEMQIMAGKPFATDRLGQVRDAFLFSCYTGLAYADIRKLKRSEISSGIDGEKWIFTRPSTMQKCSTERSARTCKSLKKS